MARIYKITDRIPVKIHDIEINIAPLSFEDKSICLELITSGNHMKAAVYAMQCCVKSVKGVENADGSQYELVSENGKLSSSCVDDLLNMSESPEMQFVAMTLLQGVPREFVDPSTGKPIKGVEFINEKKSNK